MRDEIVEVMVKCRTNIGLAILRIICFVLCALAVLGATAIGGGLLMYAVAVAFGAAGYFAGSYSQVEYEYAYCEKEIDIDAIYSQSRRKHIMTLSLDKMEAIAHCLCTKRVENVLRFVGLRKHFAVLPGFQRNAGFFEHSHQLQIVVTVQTAADTPAVFAVFADELLNGTAMGNIAHSISAQKQLLAGTGRFLQDQFSRAHACARLRARIACSIKQPGSAAADHDAVVYEARI